ncbi:MAG: YjgF/chorismate mutase-like, putative endoribonuclease, partial [Pseudomonadota bacterium]
MNPEDKLKALGISLPDIPIPVANYVSFKRAGKILYLSG